VAAVVITTTLVAAALEVCGQEPPVFLLELNTQYQSALVEREHLWAVAHLAAIVKYLAPFQRAAVAAVAKVLLMV
jgi:hypothetical protein